MSSTSSRSSSSFLRSLAFSSCSSASLLESASAPSLRAFSFCTSPSRRLTFESDMRRRSSSSPITDASETPVLDAKSASLTLRLRFATSPSRRIMSSHLETTSSTNLSRGMPAKRSRRPSTSSSEEVFTVIRIRNEPNRRSLEP